MKKAMLRIFIPLLLITMLYGCGSRKTEAFVWQDTPTVPQKNESLTIFCMDWQKSGKMVQLALTRYRALHPDVDVNLEMPEYIDYDTSSETYQHVAAEVMAGKGPDILLLDGMYLDMEKLVRQGIFADMEPFFEADGFDWTPYQQTVMNGGVYNGKRYIIPLSYDFPLLITTREALEETGFDMDACSDAEGFMKETMRFMEDPAQTRRLFFNYSLIGSSFTEHAGIRFANYDTKTVDLSAPELKEGLLWCKTVIDKYPMGMVYGGGLYGAAAVRDGEVLWVDDILGALDNFYYHYSALKTIGEPVMMPVRDLNGTIQASIQYPVAVRGNSENLQNAYDFIKLLLSEEVQRGYNWQKLSVLNSVNDYFYQRTAAGEAWHIEAGTLDFFSTTKEYEALDWPSREEYQEFMGYVNEIAGTYYGNHLRLIGNMKPFIYDGADYEETAQDAKRKLEIYLSE